MASIFGMNITSGLEDVGHTHLFWGVTGHPQAQAQAQAQAHPNPNPTRTCFQP